MKKGKRFIIGVGAVMLCAAVGFGVYIGVVRVQSQKHNLIRASEKNLPSPILKPTGEFDIQLSEVKMHYAVYGNEGHPLILVHGNGGSLNSLTEAAQYLANHYTVYVIESRCHGQSSDPGKINYDLMAKDIKEFIEAMSLKKPYLAGHSDGGINALTVAYTYPDLLGGFVSFGANTTPDTFKFYFPLGVRINDIGKNDKLNKMMLTEPNITAEDLQKITCPAYIVAGEFDIMWLSDTVFIHQNTKNSEIAIIKGENHSSYVSQNGKKAYNLIHNFFTDIENKNSTSTTESLPYVTGTVTEIHENYAIIKTDTMEGYPKGTLCNILLSKINRVNFDTGDIITVYYSGEVMETYPLQLKEVVKIELK